MSEEIKKRLKEPSTYCGLALLFLLGGKTVPPELMAQGADTILTAISGIGGILAVILKEFKGE